MLFFSFIISYILLFIGCFFAITSAFGVIRFSDFYVRIHLAGINDSFAAPLIFLGIIAQNGLSIFSFKIILLIIFMMITGPTASHALIKSYMILDKDKEELLPEKN